MGLSEDNITGELKDLAHSNLYLMEMCKQSGCEVSCLFHRILTVVFFLQIRNKLELKLANHAIYNGYFKLVADT